MVIVSYFLYILSRVEAVYQVGGFTSGNNTHMNNWSDIYMMTVKSYFSVVNFCGDEVCQKTKKVSTSFCLVKNGS